MWILAQEAYHDRSCAAAKPVLYLGICFTSHVDKQRRGLQCLGHGANILGERVLLEVFWQWDPFLSKIEQ